MKLEKLPATIIPATDAKRKLDYSGYYVASDFKRLSQSTLGYANNLTNTTEEKTDSIPKVLATWSSIIDEIGLVVIKGKASTRVLIECQRCVEPFAIDLNVEFKLTPVYDLDKVTIPDYYEPLLCNSFGEADILNAIEDELLLNLPTIPIHPLNDCKVKDEIRYLGDTPPETPKNNSFAALDSFKSLLKK